MGDVAEQVSVKRQIYHSICPGIEAMGVYVGKMVKIQGKKN